MNVEAGLTHIVRSPHDRWRRRRTDLASPPVKSLRREDSIAQISRRLPVAQQPAHTLDQVIVGQHLTRSGIAAVLHHLGRRNDIDCPRPEFARDC